VLHIQQITIISLNIDQIQAGKSYRTYKYHQGICYRY